MISFRRPLPQIHTAARLLPAILVSSLIINSVAVAGEWQPTRPEISETDEPSTGAALLQSLYVEHVLESDVTETEIVPVSAVAVDPLQTLVEDAINVTSRRMLTADVNTPWQIAHGVLALRDQYYLKTTDGKTVKALDWISSGPTFAGKPWFVTTTFGGKGQPFTEPYHFEGHPNQFLALFTLARLPREFEFTAAENGRKFTIADWIHNAKMECNDHEEMTWTLWSLAFYIEPDAEWYNKDGEQWSMERLIRKQMQTPVTKAACGGNHGLFAIACARNAYLQAGNPLRGVWLEGHMYLQKYIQIARQWQNSDGSFSSQWYKSSEHSDDIARRLSTTGHCLEFLMVVLPQSEINQPWIRNAVNRIGRDLVDNQAEPIGGKGVGGMYHALNALTIYRDRMGWNKKPEVMATGETETEIR